MLGGRLADPSLFVGPICHELGWALDDWEPVGHATLVGHLLECGVHMRPAATSRTRRTASCPTRTGSASRWPRSSEDSAVVTKLPTAPAARWTSGP